MLIFHGSMQQKEKRGLLRNKGRLLENKRGLLSDRGRFAAMQPLISKSNKKNKKGYFGYIPFFNQSMETDVCLAAWLHQKRSGERILSISGCKCSRTQ